MSGYCDHGLSSEKNTKRIYKVLKGYSRENHKNVFVSPIAYYLNGVKLTKNLYLQRKEQGKN
jgi:hypothetical protein